MNQIASDEIVNLGSGRAGPRRLHHLPLRKLSRSAPMGGADLQKKAVGVRIPGKG